VLLLLFLLPIFFSSSSPSLPNYQNSNNNVSFNNDNEASSSSLFASLNSNIVSQWHDDDDDGSTDDDSIHHRWDSKSNGSQHYNGINNNNNSHLLTINDEEEEEEEDDGGMSKLNRSIINLIAEEKKRTSCLSLCCCCLLPFCSSSSSDEFLTGATAGRNQYGNNGDDRRNDSTETEAEEERTRIKRLKWLAKSVVDKTIESIIGDPVSATGFVTFSSLTAAVVATRCRPYDQPQQMLISPAPQTDTIIWSNLEQTIERKMLKHILSIAFAAGITLLFAIPIVAVSGTLSAKNLEEMLPSLQAIIERLPLVESGLAFVAPLVIMTMVVCLPPIYSVTCRFIFRETRSSSETHKHVLQRYFALLFWNVLVVLLLSSTVLTTLESLWHNPKDLLTTIGNSFPQVSNFFIDYILIKWGCGLGMELTRFACFFQAAIKALLSNDYTRQQREKMMLGCRSISRSGGFYFGKFLAEHCLVFTIVMVYSIIAPLILPIGLIYFASCFVVYKRQLLFCYEPEINCQGEFWPQCFHRCIIAVIASQFALICMLVFLEGFKQLPFLIFLPPLTIIYENYMKKHFADCARYLPLSTARAVDDKIDEEVFGNNVELRAESLRDLYTQPSLIARSEPVYNRGDGGYTGKRNLCGNSVGGSSGDRSDEQMRDGSVV
jgi:hypothetical protein